MGDAIATALFPMVGVEPLLDGEANRLLTLWGHYLGPCERPFGKQAFALHIDGQPLSVAVSASTVSATVPGVGARQELVELARLCSAPDARWATRVMLRLWREVHSRQWPYWPVRAAVAYSQNDRHDGRIYRFDGWTKVRETRGSSGGGQWTKARTDDDPSSGAKSLWTYPIAAPTVTPRED